MFNCAVFDLDGTLLNTIDTIAFYCNRTLEKFGLPDIDTQKYKYFVGEGAKLLIQRMFEFNSITDENIISEAYNYYVPLYDTNVYYKTEPYDGIKELLEEIKKRKMKLAVLSNKPHSTVVSVISHFFGSDMFDLCYGQQDKYPRKPDPYMLNMILGEFGEPKSKCLYCGDTKTDILTGKNAGVYTVGALWGFRTRDELCAGNADLIAENPQQILDIL